MGIEISLNGVINLKEKEKKKDVKVKVPHSLSGSYLRISELCLRERKCSFHSKLWLHYSESTKA